MGRFALSVFTLGIVVCHCLFASALNAETPPGEEKSGQCVVELRVSRGASPWSGLTSSAEEERSGKHLKADAIDGKLFTPLQSLRKYNIGGAPLLGKSMERRRVVINKRFFSDIERGDATRMKVGDKEAPAVMGKILNRSFKSLKPRDLALFLVEAEIVVTYWHIESNLCLFKEEDSDGIYTAYFKGSHTYYTNERNDPHIEFGIRIDKKSGELSLVRAIPQ